MIRDALGPYIEDHMYGSETTSDKHKIACAHVECVHVSDILQKAISDAIGSVPHVPLTDNDWWLIRNGIRRARKQRIATLWQDGNRSSLYYTIYNYMVNYLRNGEARLR